MERRRRAMEARGLVQGVGFRPAVFRLASELGLAGFVRNHPAGVEIEIEGPEPALEAFLRRLPRELPPHASLRTLGQREVAPLGERGFRIAPSLGEGSPVALVLPDLATCPHCLRELRDPGDRRHRYPFLNCTLCGPRYSVLQRLPYDRLRTTMAGFPMCAECRTEYEDPRDRRFHAQPTACHVCGPQLALWDRAGIPLSAREQALQEAAEALRGGAIVAVKGLGGFHLMVDARSPEGVARLRARKGREEKPLAVMAPGMGWVAQACRATPREERLLASPSAPIVLLRRRRPEAVALGVAPGLERLGVMLPYTPLHHLLMDELGFPLVATSGNLAEQPICSAEAEALEQLSGVADLFLVHDRPIAHRVDDSVARVVAGVEQVLRRARGYAPLPILLPEGLEAPPTLAVGGHQKASVALTVGREVVLSQHLGDLDTQASREHFEQTCARLASIFEVRPEVVACDLHPDYASTRHAEGLGLPVVAVQHHLAHLYGVMLEHGLSGPVLGVCWDGTGWGGDGTIWGGEFLRADGAGWARVAHLRPFSLPGGERAVREPRRCALALLHELGVPVPEGLAGRFTEEERRVLGQLLEGGAACPRTTSAGRLFDGVAALLGLHPRASFEGQAAMALEALADPAPAEPYPYLFEGGVADWGPTLRELLRDLQAGISPGRISARFHETMAALITAMAVESGEARVALTGGCFQSARLTERCVRRLRDEGLWVYLNSHLPPNDGGLAGGQALGAALQLAARRAAPPLLAGRPS